MSTLVVGQGETYATIGAAVRAAAEGDTIYVRNGIYRETVRLGKSGLTLMAEPGHTPIVDGGWDGRTVQGTFVGVIQAAAEGVTVRGLQVRNARGRGIGISASHVTVGQCYIDTCYKSGMGANAPAGQEYSDLLVEDNVIVRAGQERLVTGGGSVNGSFIWVQVRDSVFRRNQIINCLGEGINVDKGCHDCLFDGNVVLNVAHAGIYINHGYRNIVHGNIVVYTGATKPIGQINDAPAGIVIGDEAGAGAAFPPSAANTITGNVIVGTGKLFQVRNNASNYDTSIDEETVIAGNTFVALPWTTRGIEVMENLRGRPHGAAEFRDNVIEFGPAAPGAEIAAFPKTLRAHHNGWSSMPESLTESDVVDDLMLTQPDATLSDEWQQTGLESAGFNLNNYRPRPDSPLVGAASDGTTIGALEPLSDGDEQEPDEWVRVSAATWRRLQELAAAIGVAAVDAATLLDGATAAINELHGLLQETE